MHSTLEKDGLGDLGSLLGACAVKKERKCSCKYAKLFCGHFILNMIELAR